jgi:SAM-dependent methyltransferase
MEDLDLPKADLIYASYSLPFCSRAGFPRIWKNIRRALVPGGHFAGQLFGDRDEWVGERPLLFHTLGQARRLTQGYRVDLFRETEDESISYSGRKHWHFFDLILEKPSSGRPATVGSAA